MSYNKKAHLQANIEAIRTAFTLDREKRGASEGERSILQQYSGFGGLKCILNPSEKEQDKAYWGKSELYLYPLVSDLHSLIRENSRDEQEYKRYSGSLKTSILTAFYTPPEVTQAISDTLKGNGIIPTRFLEPSAGNGAFADAFRQSFPTVETTCYEKDLLTGKILFHLNPGDKIHIRGFEEIEGRPDNKYDVVASNIPFGDTAVFDTSFSKSSDTVKRQATRTIHNYFFLKGVETLREGGILAFITSQGVMNSPSNEPVRRWLMNNTNLVSAVRLPNNLMSDNAGTEVGSDLIILQKNSSKTLLTPDETLFLKSRILSNGTTINNYFRDFDRVVHTKGYAGKDLYGKPAMVFLHEGGVQGMAKDLAMMLSGDFAKNLNKSLYEENPIQTPGRNQPVEHDRQDLGAYIDPSGSRQVKEQPLQKVSDDEFTEEDYEEIAEILAAIKAGKWEEYNAKNNPALNGSGKAKPEAKPMIQAPEPKPAVKVEQQPLMTLYDLFGLNQEERKELNTNKRGKKKAKHVAHPRQLDLFSGPQNPQAKQNPSIIYPVADARQEEHQKQLRRLEEPRPYSGILSEHHRQGSLVVEKNGQAGFLKECYRDDAVFKSLELNPLQKAKIDLYVALRDRYHDLYAYEANCLRF